MNVFITGATGCRNSFLACAFGKEACKQYYDVKYLHLPDLLFNLEIARANNTYQKKDNQICQTKASYY